MSSKRKAPPNDDDDLSSFKVGRPNKAYSIADAVRLVSHCDISNLSLHVFLSFVTEGHKCSDIPFILLLRKICTN
jgi:hypothetical protein